MDKAGRYGSIESSKWQRDLLSALLQCYVWLHTRVPLNILLVTFIYKKRRVLFDFQIFTIILFFCPLTEKCTFFINHSWCVRTRHCDRLCKFFYTFLLLGTQLYQFILTFSFLYTIYFFTSDLSYENIIYKLLKLSLIRQTESNK